MSKPGCCLGCGARHGGRTPHRPWCREDLTVSKYTRWRRRQREAARCRDCPSPAPPGRTRCVPCAARHAAAQTARTPVSCHKVCSVCAQPGHDRRSHYR